jgi:hypothetical protein
MHILHMSMFCMFILYILHINTKYAEQNRALLDTLRIHQSNNNRDHIVLYAILLIGHTQHKGHMRVSSWPFVRGNRSRPIARTWCLSARLGYLMGRFSSGWITYGSANFCSCSTSIQRQILTETGMQYHECAYVSVFFSFYFAYCAYCFAYSSILFDIFSIFCILQYAEYEEYEPCTIFLHILLHILHIFLHTAAYYLTYSAYSAYCNMQNMQNMNPACFLACFEAYFAYFFAYICINMQIAYCFAYICINMQNNMQTPKSYAE